MRPTRLVEFVYC